MGKLSRDHLPAFDPVALIRDCCAISLDIADIGNSCFEKE